MRKNRIFSAAIAAALAAGTGPAMAAVCTTTFALTSTQISALLNPGGSNQACILGSCSASASNTWAESGSPDDNETIVGGLTGSFYDYKKGPSTGVDPSKLLGTYTITGTPGTITYSYTGGTPYTYNIIPKTEAPSIIFVTQSGGTATGYFSAQATAPMTGGVVVVAGVGNSSYNGTFTVTGGSTTTVQYVVSGSPGPAGGGTATFAIAGNPYNFCQTSPNAGTPYSITVATGTP